MAFDKHNNSGSKNAAKRLASRFAKKRSDIAVENNYEDQMIDSNEAKVMVRSSIDMWFMLIVLALLCFGAVMSFSASAVYAEQRYGNSTYFLWRYILFAVIAIIGTVPFIMYARPWFWRLFGVCSYAVSVILLLLVLLIGSEGGGAQRWIAIGPITIQPSEVAKMSIANSNKRVQRPSSLYYAVASRVTDVRAVCRMHSSNPEAASCKVERSGAKPSGV